MKRLVVSALALAAFALSSCGSQSEPSAPSGAPAGSSTSQSNPGTPIVAEQAVIATGLTTPWGISFLRDGSALVTERDTGRIVRVSAPSSEPSRVATVGQVTGTFHQEGGENGLLGIAVAPGESPAAVFVYYTTRSDNRIARMAWDGNRLGPPSSILTGIPANTFHNGGRLVFGPDGYLYIGTGDARDPASAQQRSSLAGKILRITTDGSAAPGNPFGGSRVWSLGHRNVQGLAFDSDQRLWATEFGEQSHDELNLIVKGQNYGWPVHEGRANDPAFADPYVQWPTAEASPSGLAIIGEWAYMAALRGKRLWQVGIADPHPVGPNELFVGEYGRLRTPVFAPDGSLWVTTSNTDGRATPGPSDDRIIQFTVR